LHSFDALDPNIWDNSGFTIYPQKARVNISIPSKGKGQYQYTPKRARVKKARVKYYPGITLVPKFKTLVWKISR
jgi:hypothetical protein